MKPLRLGTRGSALAVAQTGWVERRLRELHPGLETERVVITTSGDRFSASSAPMEGAFDKGLFVKEIEEALLAGRIDVGVHSAKDLPSALPSGLAIGAFPQRESARDILIARAGADLAGLPVGARVASSSLRRQVQLRMLRPDLAFVPARGNVDTRLRKLEAGEFEALVLAEAGLKRLGITVSGHVLQQMVPAPGQGALALEVRAGDDRVLSLAAALDDARTRAAVSAERLFQELMGGGCNMPLGAWGELDGNWLRLSVFWSDPEGRSPVQLAARAKLDPAKVRLSVEELARRVKEIASARPR